MNKEYTITADYRDGRVYFNGKNYPAGTFIVNLMNDYYKDDAAARVSVYQDNVNFNILQQLKDGDILPEQLKKTGIHLLQALKGLEQIRPVNKIDISGLKSQISVLFTEETGKEISSYLQEKTVITNSDWGSKYFGTYQNIINNDIEDIIEKIKDILYFFENLSSGIIKSHTAITEFCNRLDEAERFDEAHLLPIAIEIFGISVFDVECEYVASKKTASSKSASVARRLYFDNFYSFIITDFFEGLHYGHYPRRCEICQKYFLMTSATRQKYCSGYSPYKVKGKAITCRKYAARINQKELAENNPVIRIYRNRCSAIRVEKQRGKITADFAAAVLKIAKENMQKAQQDDTYARVQYEIDMNRDNLYTKVNIK